MARVKDTFGYKGFLKVISLSDFNRLEKEKTLFYYTDDGKRIDLIISTVKIRPTYYLVSFKNITSQNEAKKLKGKILLTDESPKLNKGEFHYQDLLNLKVSLLNGEIIGYVENVMFLPNQEVLEVKDKNGKVILIPFAQQFINKIDNNIIYITPIEGLL